MALLAPRLDPQRAGVPRLQGKSAGASATSGWERGRPDLPPTPKRGGHDPTSAKCGGPRALGLTPRARQTRRLYELSPSQPQPECTCGMTLIGWPGHVDGYCHVERRRSWTGIKLMRQRAGGRALRKPPSGTFDPEESIRAHRNLLRAGNPLAPAVTQPGATGPPGVKSRRRVIPVVTRSSHRRISPRRPLGRCAGVRRLRTQTQPQGARGLSPSG